MADLQSPSLTLFFSFWTLYFWYFFYACDVCVCRQIHFLIPVKMRAERKSPGNVRSQQNGISFSSWLQVLEEKMAEDCKVFYRLQSQYKTDQQLL